MDNITHTLFALTLARTPLGRAGRGATAALVIGSNAPDVDIVATALGGVSYLEWHRGPTHGPIGIVVLGVVSACLVWAGYRVWEGRRETPAAETPPSATATFGTLASIAVIGALLHVLIDLPTSYGTRVLSPFDWHWFAADWMPIVDLYLLIALAVGLVFGEVSKTSRRRLAAIVLMLMGANYGLRAVSHRQALQLAPRVFGPLLPALCDPSATGPFIDRWPRERASRPPDASSSKPCLMEIAATPTFFSPFRWRVIAQLSNGYQLHDISVLDARFQREATDGEAFWRRSVRYPNQWTPATLLAATTRTARTFLGFSRFPAARTFTDPSGLSTVRWNDMRFVAGVWPGDAQRQSGLFSVVVRVASDGHIVEERLGQ